jgi:hypothetical protein
MASCRHRAPPGRSAATRCRKKEYIIRVRADIGVSREEQSNEASDRYGVSDLYFGRVW